MLPLALNLNLREERHRRELGGPGHDVLETIHKSIPIVELIAVL